MKAIIKAKLEISHHDGYCSGEENEYKSDIQNYLIELPQIFNLQLGLLQNHNHIGINWEF